MTTTAIGTGAPAQPSQTRPTDKSGRAVEHASSDRPGQAREGGAGFGRHLDAAVRQHDQPSLLPANHSHSAAAKAIIKTTTGLPEGREAAGQPRTKPSPGAITTEGGVDDGDTTERAPVPAKEVANSSPTDASPIQSGDQQTGTGGKQPVPTALVSLSPAQMEETFFAVLPTGPASDPAPNSGVNPDRDPENEINLQTGKNRPDIHQTRMLNGQPIARQRFAQMDARMDSGGDASRDASGQIFRSRAGLAPATHQPGMRPGAQVSDGLANQTNPGQGAAGKPLSPPVRPGHHDGSGHQDSPGHRAGPPVATAAARTMASRTGLEVSTTRADGDTNPRRSLDASVSATESRRADQRARVTGPGNPGARPVSDDSGNLKSIGTPKTQAQLKAEPVRTTGSRRGAKTTMRPANIGPTDQSRATGTARIEPGPAVTSFTVSDRPRTGVGVASVLESQAEQRPPARAGSRQARSADAVLLRNSATLAPSPMYLARQVAMPIADALAIKSGKPVGPVAATIPTPVTTKIRHLDIQLQPNHLGRVTVRIRTDASGLDIRLISAQFQTAQTLRQGQDALTAALRDAGYGVNRLTITTAPEGFSRPVTAAGAASGSDLAGLHSAGGRSGDGEPARGMGADAGFALNTGEQKPGNAPHERTEHGGQESRGKPDRKAANRSGEGADNESTASDMLAGSGRNLLL